MNIPGLPSSSFRGRPWRNPESSDFVEVTRKSPGSGFHWNDRKKNGTATPFRFNQGESWRS